MATSKKEEKNQGKNKTVGEISDEVSALNKYDNFELCIVRGASLEEGIRKSKSSDRRIDYVGSGRFHGDINGAVASDYVTFFSSCLSKVKVLIIAVDDSTKKDNPNIMKYMAKGLTYDQAKVMHLLSLEYRYDEIAELEKIKEDKVEEIEEEAKNKLAEARGLVRGYL